MSYIDKNLLSDERIIFRTKKHLITFWFPILCLILAVAITPYMQANSVLKMVSFAPWIIVLILWCYSGLEYFFSDFAVTDKRIMMREGLFTRHTNELRLTAISQVNVDQSLLGMLLGYGDIAINAFGAFDTYTTLAKPGQFQRAVNEQIDRAMKP